MNVHKQSRRRRLTWLAVTLSLVASLFSVGPAPAAQAAADDVVFDGGGWGHGVGLSQWGAYGMAVQGSSHKQILAHYYTGTGVATLGNTAPLWVNLVQDFSTLTLRVEAVGKNGAPVTILRGSKSWTAKVGATIDITASGSSCTLKVKNPGADAFSVKSATCNFNFKWYDWKSASAFPSTKIVVNGCTQADWNTSPTSHPECQYARGMLHLRSGSGGLDLSAEMLLDDYVMGISEMPYYWANKSGAEALKAQAVAARSYARELQITRGDPATNNCAAWCHVRDTTWDQRYVGWGHGSDNWVAAVNATRGQVVTHPDAPNGVVRAYYFSTSAGRTESAHEKFSGFAPREYYTAVGDLAAVDGTVPNPHASWKVKVDPAKVATALGLDKLTSVAVTTTRPSSGSAAAVTYTGVKNGETKSIEKTGSWTRSTFGLRSEFFDVAYNTSATPPPSDPTTPAPSDPTASGECVNVRAGDGWWTTTVRLGLAGNQYPAVKEANPAAENAQGYLIIGAEVCAPGSTPTTGLAPAPTSPNGTVCTVVQRGESWWHQAEKLGITGAQWPTLKAANAAAIAPNGYLIVGAVVCLPGSEPAPTPTSGSCTVAQAGDGWIAVGARIGWPYSKWQALAAANPSATNSAGYLMVGAEVCAPS